MTYRYVHDEESKSVHRFPAEPSIYPQMDKAGPKGKVTAWRVRMEIEKTQADNKLVNSQWTHPTSQYPFQIFEAYRYSEDEARSYFMQNHTPKGVEITEDEFESLRTLYETEAQSN